MNINKKIEKIQKIKESSNCVLHKFSFRLNTNYKAYCELFIVYTTTV